MTAASCSGVHRTNSPSQETRKRHRVRPRTMMTGVFATTLVLSISIISAFVPGCITELRPRLSLQARSGTHVQMDVSESQQLPVLGVERGGEERRRVKTVYRPSDRKSDEQLLTRTSTPIQFRGLTTNRKKPYTSGSGNSELKSTTVPLPNSNRQLTMPGFASETVGQRAYKDGIQLLERRSGHKHLESPSQTRQRYGDSTSKLYASSANAPESLMQFSREIQRHRLLTHAEEKELGKAIQEAIRLQRLYDLLEAKLDRPPTDVEWCAAADKTSIDEIQQVMENGRHAKNKLVVSNLRLVQKVVNTYLRNGLAPHYNAADMMQEGIMALIRAAEKYEPNRGWKFSTYGMYWIRSAVKEAQELQSRLIPLPQKLRANCKRLLRQKKLHYQLFGRWPTREELGKALGLSEYQVDRCIKALEVECLSLDQPFAVKAGEPAKGTMADEIHRVVDKGDFAKYNRLLLQEDIIQAMERHLAPQELELLLLRYGLKGQSARPGGVATLLELSNIYGFSTQKVITIINRSLKKLKSMGHEDLLPFL